MAELKIHVGTDGTGALKELENSVSNVQKSADQLSHTMYLVNKAAEGQTLYFATTKARDGFIALVNEASRLEKKLADPAMKGDKTFPELAGHLDDLHDKITDMASSASMASRVMSTKFSREVSDATNVVDELGKKVIIAERNIENLKQKMANRSIALGGKVDNDLDYQAWSAELTVQKGILSSSKTQLEENTTRLEKLRGAQMAFGNATVSTTNDVESFVEKLNRVPIAGEATSGVFSKLKWAAGDLSMALLGSLGGEQLAVRIFNTRSMMQKLEISFETMLQSADKAKSLMGQLTETAAKTPFGMMDVTNGAKQLLAYGTAAEDVNGILVKLGDIAAGLGLPMGDLVYLYGTTMAQGRMFTQDLRQFMGRGIPMAEELGKILVAQGKATKGTMAEVQDAVTKGKVSGDMVKQAIEGMTAAGSRFGGLMDRQSATLSGRWANIEDTVDMMFNDMGKSTEGIFNTSLDFISKMIDNWQSIVKVIGMAVTAVGSYKTGLALAAAIQNRQAKTEHNEMLSPLDGRIKELQGRENDANSLVGHNIAEDLAKKEQERIVKLVADADISDQEVSKTIESARQRGIINDELAEELRLKREILMSQERLTAQAEEEASKVAKTNAQERQTAIDNDPVNVAAAARNAAQKELDDKKRELAEIDAEIAALQRKEPTQEYGAYRTAYTNYANASNNRRSVETAYNVANNKYNEQNAYVNQLGNELGEVAVFDAQYQAEVARLAELKTIRDNTKNAFVKACEQEKQSLDKVKAAQDALNSSSTKSRTDKEFETRKACYEADVKDLQVQEQKLKVIEQQIAEQERKVADTQNGDYANVNSSIDAQNELAALQTQQTEILNACDEASQRVQQSMEALRGSQEKYNSTLVQSNEAEGTAAEAADAIGDAMEKIAENSEGVATAKGTETAATEAGTVATETNSVADNVNTQSKKAAELQARRKTVAQEVETASTKLNTAQTQLDTAWQTNDAMAKNRNGIAALFLGAKNAAAGAMSKVGAVGMQMFNAAVVECKAAFDSLKIALMTNPITAIFTVLTTVGTGLYMLWDSLFGKEDEAENATASFSNVAAEAASKVNSLYAQMETAAGGTKAKKEAMAELIKTCEEYGVEIDKTILKGNDETAKQEELIKAHDALTASLKAEAEQREYLNQLKAIGETKETDTDNAWKDFGGGLDEDYFKKTDTANMRSIVSQEDIDQLAEYNRLIKDAYQNGGDYMALTEEYNNLRHKVQIQLEAYTVTLMKHKGMEDETGDAIYNLRQQFPDLIQNLTNAASKAKESADATEAGRAAFEATKGAIDGYTASTAQSATQARILKTKVDDVNSAVETLLRQHGHNTVDFKFRAWLENVNVPKWMLAKTTKELQKNVAQWAGLLAKYDKESGGSSNYKMNVKGHGGMTRKDIEAQLGGYTSALDTKNAEDKKREADLEATKKEREKAAKKAAAAAKKAAADKSKRETATDKANTTFEKTLTSFSEKANETILKNATEAMEDGTQKELQKIEDSTRRQLDAIEEQKRKLIEARKKQAEAVWVNAKTGRKANEWKNTADGKMTDAQWWAELSKTTAKDKDGNAITSNGKTQTLGDLVASQQVSIEQERAKAIAKQYQSELQSMSDYIKQYGSFQQQRLAISKEYARKIADIEKSTKSDEDKRWEINSLRKEQSTSLSNIDAKELIDNANLAAVFESYGAILKEPLKQTVAQLEAFTRTGEFKNRDINEQKTIYDAITKAKASLGETGSLKLGDVGLAVADYNNALVEQATAQRAAAEATQEYITAEQALIAAKQKGDAATIAQAQAEVNAAYAKMQSTESTQNEATARVASTQAKANHELERFNNKLEKVKSTISSLQGGSFSAIWNLFGDKLQTKIGAYVSGFGKINKEFETMASLLGSQGLNLDDFNKKFANAMNGVVSSITSGDTASEITEKIRGGVTNIFSDVFGDNSDKFSTIANKAGDMIGQIFNGTEGSLEDKASSASKAIGSLISNMASVGQSSGSMWGAIIGLVLQLLDEFAKDGLSTFVEELLTNIGAAVEGLLTNLFTKLIPAIIEGVCNIIKGVVGGIGGMIGFKDIGLSDPELKDDVERLTASNEALQKSVELLADKMDEATSMNDITDTYEQQKANLEKSMANTQEMMYRSAKAYSNGTFGIGGKRSSASHLASEAAKYYGSILGMGGKENFLRLVSEAAGTTITSFGAIFEMTSKQMKDLAMNAPDLYAFIKEHADDGKENASQYMDTYIEYQDQLDELLETYNEKLTNVSFDSVESEFQSLLEDMDSSASDFTDNFADMMRKSIISSMMTETYKQKLKTWYENFTKAYKDDNALDKDEIKSSRAEYEGIVSEALAEREALFKTLGIDAESFDQDASSGAYEAMSQDTGEELNGRFTAVQEATEGTWYQAQLINEKLDLMMLADGVTSATPSTSYTLPTFDGTTELANYMLQGNLIADEGRTVLAQMQLALASIDDRQQGWEKPLKTMWAQIKDIRDDIHTRL